MGRLYQQKGRGGTPGRTWWGLPGMTSAAAPPR